MSKDPRKKYYDFHSIDLWFLKFFALKPSHKFQWEVQIFHVLSYNKYTLFASTDMNCNGIDLSKKIIPNILQKKEKRKKD